MKRVLALDIGTVRIGAAVSDPLGTFAQGVGALRAEGDWLDGLAELIGRYGAEMLLVGMPRRTDGTEGPEAASVRARIAEIARRFPDMEIAEHDERFTTAIANKALLEADVSRAGRRERVDKVAAALILQSWLDERNGGAPPPEPPAPEPAPRKGGARAARKAKGRYG